MYGISLNYSADNFEEKWKKGVNLPHNLTGLCYSNLVGRRGP